MKCTSFLLLLFTLTLSLFSTKVSAQDKVLVTPINSDIIAQQIATTYEGFIDVSTTDIKNFFDDHYASGGTNSGCQHPDVSVTSPNDSIILFDWEDVAGAEYIVSSLRLTGGTIESYPLNDSYFEQEGPTKNLYLFVFQSTCGAYKSNLEGIIIDKPVMFSDFMKGCDCNGKTEIGLSNNNTIELDFFSPWTAQETYEGYVFEFEFDDANQTTVRFPAVVEFEDYFPVNVYLHPDCRNEIGISDTRTSIYIPNGEEGNLAVLSFGLIENEEVGFGFDFSPTVSETISATITIKRCDRIGKIKSDWGDPFTLKSTLFQSQPNPFYSTTTISYSLPKEENVSISIYNNYGQEVTRILNETSTTKGMHQLELDLSNFPAGMYHCILKTDTGLQTLKLLRIE